MGHPRATQTQIYDFDGPPHGVLDGPTSHIVKDPTTGRAYIKQSPKGEFRWKEITNDTVSITDYGADPFGVQDSTAAFEAAAAAAHNVIVPYGTYRVSDTIRVPNRTSIYGMTPENGSNIAEHRTIIKLYHREDGFAAAQNPASAIAIRNLYIERQPEVETSNALIRLENSTGSVVEGCWGMVVGIGQGVVLGPASFMNRISLSKFYGDGGTAKGVQLVWPSTVNQIQDCMLQFPNGSGACSDTPDNQLINTNLEFCAIGFEARTHADNFGGPYGTGFFGCHFENCSVAAVDLRGIAIPVDMTFNACQFSINNENFRVEPVTGLRAAQNLKFLGGIVGSPTGNVNATISARFGGMEVSTEPYAGGTKVHEDIVHANPTSYAYRGFFSQTVATGARYIEAFRYDGSAHASFLLIDSLRTFTYSPAQAVPEFTITDPKSGDWVDLEALGGLVFNTADTSGNGPGPVAAIKALNIGGTVSPFGALGFHVSGANRVLDSTSLKAVLDLYGRLALGTTTLSDDALLEVNSVTRGIMWPRMTEAQRDAIVNKRSGLTVYNTTSNKFQGYAAGSWVDFH